MLKIGEFSRLSQVTVKTLHHYDDIRLLMPAHVDKFTNHRYYTTEQLVRVHRIVALKALGLSLEQIKLMLEEQMDVQEVRGMLRLKQNEIQQRLNEEQAQLAQVEFRLRMMEMEEHLPNIEVIIKKVPPVRALTIRLSIPQSRLTLLGQEIEQAFDENNIKMISSCTEIRYADEFEPSFEDVEFVLPVEESHTADVELASFGTMKVTTVPAKEMATFIHRGVHTQPHEEAVLMVQRWVVANGYELGGTNRMVHHLGPFDHAEYADWITEIQHEIVKG